MSGIKSLQNVCLEILKEVDRVCRKHNILYWLEGGSMLGAVRHRWTSPCSGKTMTAFAKSPRRS